MNDYLNVIRNNYANFTGRARRREYWMFQLANAVVLLVLAALMAVGGLNLFTGMDPSNPPAISPLGWLFFTAYMIYNLAVFVPSLAVTVRRLHDAGYSGWMYLIVFIPLIGGITLLVFTIMESKPESNKWGANPKGQGVVAPRF